jgi:hypothetical protein
MTQRVLTNVAILASLLAVYSWYPWIIERVEVTLCTCVDGSTPRLTTASRTAVQGRAISEDS